VNETPSTRIRHLAGAVARLGWIVLVLAAVICAYAVIATMSVSAPIGRTFADWATYVHAVDRMLSGAPIYAPEQLSGTYVLVGVTLFGYAYPPSSVPMFLPFITYPVGLVLWLTVNVGLLLTGLYAILRRELGRTQPLAFAAVLLGLAFLRGFTEGVSFGNASVGLAGLFAWSWVIGRGRTSIGTLTALGATIKLVPGALLFWSTPRSFVRVLLAALAVGAALAVLTLPLVGIQSWLDYLKALSFSEPACAVDGTPNSVACILKPALGIGGAKLAGIVIALVAGGLAVVVRWPVLSFALVAIAWLAPVTDLHFHYYLVLYVAGVVACASWLGGRRKPATGPLQP
jgi:hypothetical protein